MRLFLPSEATAVMNSCPPGAPLESLSLIHQLLRRCKDMCENKGCPPSSVWLSVASMLQSNDETSRLAKPASQAAHLQKVCLGDEADFLHRLPCLRAEPPLPPLVWCKPLPDVGTLIHSSCIRTGNGARAVQETSTPVGRDGFGTNPTGL